jgi:hypothetical protein
MEQRGAWSNLNDKCECEREERTRCEVIIGEEREAMIFGCLHAHEPEVEDVTGADRDIGSAHHREIGRVDEQVPEKA